MRSFQKWVWGYCTILALTLLAAHLGSRAVTVLSETTPIHRDHTIVIDAGHGGVDGGAVSCTGVPESRLNLEIALRLEAVFHLLGYDTEMIRTEDISVYTKGETIARKKISDLKERVRRVNDTDNALLLSIHQNTFPDGRYSGAQVFYAGTSGSRELACQLQSSLNSSLSAGSRRQEKQADGIYLMEHIRCRGVLVECGFLSNHQEEQRLRNADYQKKLSAVIACTTAQYLANT
ncbi:MAG: N-acetylmuramoyl-L-alanine amidase [Oscillospiraceae bacterium]|nr:N-acetylmuramoyl-L-alanine amidase [Oscillospiraceae bacterium]